MGRAPTASEHALFSSVFVGATLRGRPFRNVNFAGLPQRQNTTFIAHFGRCQKFAFRSVLPFSHKSFAFVGALRRTLRNMDYTGRSRTPPLRIYVSKCEFCRAPAASEHALFSSLFLKEKHRFFGGSSFIPQKQSFCGNPTMSVSKYGFQTPSLRNPRLSE